MSEIILRPATVDDAAEMLAIYAPYVIQTTVSSEYDAPTLEEFTRRIRTFTESCRGSCASSTARSQATATLLRTAPARHTSGRWRPRSVSRRTGTATASPARSTPRLFEVLAMQGYYNIYVGITSPNERSMKFHKSMGFVISGAYQESMYKFGQWRDVLWMGRSLRPHDTARPSRPCRSRRSRTARS